MRDLTANEVKVIQEFASRLSSEDRDILLADLTKAAVESIPGIRSRIVFSIAGYQRPAYRGQHPFNVEGKVDDQDGSELAVLLHADENGRLLELELVRFDDGDVIEPNWSTLRLW